MSNGNPSINPADQGTLAGTIQFALKKAFMSSDNMLPAKVIKYDRTLNRVSVQLQINLITTDDVQVPRAQISSIPVFVFGGGGFSLSFPLNAGDLGWVLASDRDISLFLQNYNQSAPNTERVKNFSDSVFYPDAMKSFNIDSSNEAYVILQNESGSISIELGTNLTSGHPEVNITCNRLNVNMSPTDYAVINGNLWVSGLIQNPTGLVTALPAPPP